MYMGGQSFLGRSYTFPTSVYHYTAPVSMQTMLECNDRLKQVQWYPY